MRRLVCWLLGLLCCAGPATAKEPAPQQPRRNFILIMADDVLEQHPLQEPLSPQAAEARRMLQHALVQIPARGRALLKFTRPPSR